MKIIGTRLAYTQTARKLHCGIEMCICIVRKLFSQWLCFLLVHHAKIGHHLLSAINSSIPVLPFAKPTKRQQYCSDYPTAFQILKG